MSTSGKISLTDNAVNTGTSAASASRVSDTSVTSSGASAASSVFLPVPLIPQAALATALNRLAIVVQDLNQNNQRASSAFTPILKPHSSNTPSNLGSQSGLSAFTQESEPHNTTWDSTARQFILFLLAL